MPAPKPTYWLRLPALLILTSWFTLMQQIPQAAPIGLITKWLNNAPNAYAVLNAVHTINLVSLVAMPVMIGLLIDRVGPRKCLPYAGAACTLGCWLLTSPKHHLWLLLSTVAIQIGSITALLCGLRYLINWVPKYRFASIIGTINAVSIGLLLWSPQLLSHWHSSAWQHWLYRMGFVSMLLTVGCRLFISSGPKQHHSLAWPNAQLQRALKDTVQQPNLWLCALISSSALLSFTLIGNDWGKPYLESVHHLNQHHAQLVTSTILIGGMAGSILLGIISDYLRRRQLVIVVAMISAMAVCACTHWLPESRTLTLANLWLLLGFFAAGGSLGLVLAKENCSLRISTTTMALIISCITASQSMAQWATHWWAHHQTDFGMSTTTLQQIFMVTPGLILVSLVAALGLREHPALQPAKTTSP